MPKNKNAYLRYLIIHSQIKRNTYRNGYPTHEDLLRYLHEEGYPVSGSTLEKDIRFLKDERGAPITYDRAQRCYRYTENWDFDIPLSPDDVRTMHMLMRKLKVFGDAQEFKMLKESIDKLSEHFDLAHQHPNDNIDNYILFEYAKGFAGRHLLSVIYDAIFEKREINISHCRFNSEEITSRTLQPYILKEHRNRWYVIGKEAGVSKIFGLDRIHEIQVTDKYFIQDSNFYEEIFNVLRDAVGIMAFGFESEDVVLRFNEDKANYVKTLLLHRSQEILEEDETGITIKLHVKVTLEFINECILRFGDAVKVVSPPELAGKVKQILQNAVEAYNVQ
jgi:predicted DNA-binding transcriptional regulator YafY